MVESLTERVEPFRLPLSRWALRAALERGHGRALLHLLAHPELVRDEDLLPHLLFDRAYDSQLERREGWRERLLEAVCHRPTLVRTFVERSVEPSPRDRAFWDTDTRGTVLLHLAQRGVAGAAEALRKLSEARESDADLACLDQLLELDAEEGLVLACKRLLSRVDRGWADGPNQQPLELWDWRHGQGSARRVLEQHAGDGSILRYLGLLGPPKPAAASASRPRRSHGPWSDGSGRGVRAYIEAAPEGALAWPLTRWGKEASEEDLREVAQGFAGETNPRKVSTWARVWRERCLPVVTNAFLTALADPTERHRPGLFGVAGFSVDVRLRPLNPEERGTGGVTSGSLARFGPRLRPDDLPDVLLLTQRALRDPRTDANDRHRVSTSLLQLSTWNPGVDTSQLLLLIYEQEACSVCRRDAVKDLHRLNRLPAWIREECLHDASASVRGFAESVAPRPAGP